MSDRVTEGVVIPNLGEGNEQNSPGQIRNVSPKVNQPVPPINHYYREDPPRADQIHDQYVAPK